ncbi:MAG: hypothetical protein R3B38_00315 [Patescibacteria group bacterium]
MSERNNPEVTVAAVGVATAVKLYFATHEYLPKDFPGINGFSSWKDLYLEWDKKDEDFILVIGELANSATNLEDLIYAFEAYEEADREVTALSARLTKLSPPPSLKELGKAYSGAKGKQIKQILFQAMCELV